jgi:phage terminase Nu1 subunit (DNA packaging protein)
MENLKVNKSTFARIAGCSRRTVYIWLCKGFVVAERDGKIDVVKGMAAVREIRENQRRRTIEEMLKDIRLSF